MRQGLAIRSHDDKVGNLFPLLKLQSADDDELKKWLEDRNYLSPQIVNEQVKMMGDHLLLGLLGEIHSAPWFAVLADEATVVSIDEQLCVAIRRVKK